MWEIIINNNSNNVLGSIITGLFTFFTGLIAIVVVRKQLRDSLDSKSGWRQELFKVSSKSRLLSDDVYILYTVLRFRPHDEAKKKDYTSMPPENFNEMTAYIFKELGAIEKNIDTGIQCIEHSDDEQKKYLNQKDSRKLRLFARYLLKNHWETLGNGWLKRWYWHKFEEKKMISDFYYLIKENDKEVEEKEIKKDEKNVWVKIYSYINQHFPLKGFFTYALLTIILSGLISLGFPYLLLELFSVEAKIYVYIWPFFFLLMLLTWRFKSVILARLASLILAFLTSIISIAIISEEYPNENIQLGLFEFMSIVLAITSILVVVFEIILAEFKKRSLLE